MTSSNPSRSFAVRTVRWRDAQGALRAVREAVFVVEQRIPADLEWDKDDPVCLHALAEDVQRRAIGCGRLLPDGHIGRMAVLAEWRGAGVGAALLALLIDAARERGHAVARLHAQTHAAPFYARYGFVAEGPTYLEAGIPHQTMVLKLAG